MEGEIPSIDSVRDGDLVEQLQKLVNRKLQDMQEAQWKVALSGKEIVVKDQIRKVICVILSAKDVIASAVSAEPHAALACAGVFFVLSVSYLHALMITLHFSTLTSALKLLINPITQFDEATDGLGYISELLARCRVRRTT